MKEEKIISKVLKEVINKETIVTCDICGTRAYNEKHCVACQRDICDGCSRFEGEDDYPRRFCIECWEIGKKYRTKEAEIQIKYEELLENNRDEWYRTAKETAQKKEQERIQK